MILHRNILVLGSLAAVIASGCAGGGEDACATGADCASGFCRLDGTCAPVDGTDAGPVTDAGPAIDGGDAGTALCQPDHDGVITRAEVSIAAGRRATFRVALDTPVDTAGQLQNDGSRRWDLSTSLSGDHDVEVMLDPVEGQWFADSFPDATYVTRLSDTEELLGVFEATDQALLLRGVVSPGGGSGRTELVYDPPVQVLRFPIDNSATWQSESTVSGQASGVLAYYSEHYTNRVDALGQLDTPYGTFPVKRIRVELTRTIGTAVVTSRSFAFVAECYGTVASVVSEQYESEVDFTQAAEVRRLAP
jgi:hypothetical protein